jgi:hypothetical protein
MIENFLRRPQTAAELGADSVRGFGVISILIAAIWFDLTDVGVLAFTLPGLLVPRFVGVRPSADIVFGATLLVAAWSNVLDLYTRIAWWDLLVHFACTAVMASMLYLLLTRVGIVTVPGVRRLAVIAAIVLSTVFGLALSALWEMVEWVGHAYISDEIFVAYDDSIADMAVGGLGAAVAGFVLAFAPLLRVKPLPTGEAAA